MISRCSGLVVEPVQEVVSKPRIVIPTKVGISQLYLIKMLKPAYRIGKQVQHNSKGVFRGNLSDKVTHSLKKSFLILFIIIPFAAFSQGLPNVPRQVNDTATGHRKFKDLRHMGDVFSSEKLLLGRGIISGNISYNWGRIITGGNGHSHEVYRSAIGFFTRIRPYKEYSINTTFFKNLNPNAINVEAAPGNRQIIPDFQYSFGKFDWRPKTINYGYENYSQNFYRDDAETLWEKFKEGNYFVSYQHLLPEKLMSKIRIDETSRFNISYFVRYAIEYTDKDYQRAGGLFEGKPTASLATRYTILKNIYVEGATVFYVNPEKYKREWDPDFTYGFGYYDWRHLRLSATYGNYSVNRFPWNEKEVEKYGFLDGVFTVMVNYIW